MPKVKFYAGLRKAAGTKETFVSASRLRSVLDRLVALYPSFQQQVWDGEELRPHIIITINGQHLNPMGELDLPVESDDEIAIFPPIAGG